MKLGEIKIQALKLMFVGGQELIDGDALADYLGDDTYGHFLVNMPGAINRALSLLERRRVLPVRSLELEKEKASFFGKSARFDLADLIKDFYDVDRLVYERGDEYVGAQDYRREGDVIVIADFDETAQYRLLYWPRIPRVSISTSDEQELEGIPDHIACYLPYAIKAELFREDEPDEATVAHQLFENAIAQLAREVRGEHISSVQLIYGGGLMT